MSKEFVTFQKFNDEVLVHELIELLDKNEIKYEVEQDSSSDASIMGNGDLSKEFRVKLNKFDFEKANQLLMNISKDQIEDVDKDYYLFDFTDAELMEIVAKEDEWSQYDFLLAQKLLKERGKEVRPADIDEMKKQRISELAKPDEEQKDLIIKGYALAIVGGFMSIFIGYHLATFKRQLPNGDTVYVFRKEDRKHGNRIFLLGIVCLLFWTIVAITQL